MQDTQDTMIKIKTQMWESHPIYMYSSIYIYLYLLITLHFKIATTNQFCLSDTLRWFSILCRNPPPCAAIL